MFLEVRANGTKPLVTQDSKITFVISTNTFKRVAFCGKQRLSVRGYKDDSTASNSDNKRNFVQLVQLHTENDNMLHTYPETAPRNAL